MQKKYTRQDVALKAGVSGATVSRAFNNPEQVNQETRDKVFAAAAEYGFHPNRHAAALRKRHSGVILFLELNIPGSYQWTEMTEYRALYGDIIRSLLHRVQSTLFSLQLASLVSVNQIGQLSDRFRFDGIIAFDSSRGEALEALKRLDVPVVCAHHTQNIGGVSTMSTDNLAGSAAVAQELVGLGFQKPVYVTGLADRVESHKLRLEGFRKVFPGAEVLDQVLGFDQGYQAGKTIAKLLKSKRADAVCAVNDLTAYGVIQALREQGIPVGFGKGQYAVAGYDNLPTFSFRGTTDYLTTEAHLPEIYVKAFDMLQELLKNPDEGIRREVLAPTVIRRLAP